jgi:murein DD-endopeptidase MepM/ murein hydrolase activator NlpD
LRLLIIFLLLFTFSFSSVVEYKTWGKGESLLTFFSKNGISQDVYFKLSKIDKELCAEINAGIDFQILKNNKNKIEQVLIPVSEEMQLHIFKKNNNFILDIIPIEFKELTQTVTVIVNSSPYEAIIKATNNRLLASQLMLAFKKTVNFRKMQKGNKIAINFIQRVRLGKYFGAPKITSAMVEVRKRKYYIFKNEKDGRYYDKKGRSLTSFFLRVPLRYKRISSKFTYKRWHPILKRYRAHLGIDYAAPTGRKIFAAANGRIIHRGKKGGYGNTIMIKHKGGYKTLYAHMSRYARGLKVGSRVKQGRLIGYVGTTGRSTGPHLHFGLYKNGRAINPNKIIRITKNKLKGKIKNKFLKYVKIQMTKLNDQENNITLKLVNFKNIYSLKG